MARVFISYASADRAVADEVSGWLRAAGHAPFFDHDVRDGLSLGEDWKRRLYRELRQVEAVIGVVTASFVASKWCFAEVGIADARGCRLIPLRVEADVVHPLMGELHHVDYHADPQQARERVLRAVRLVEGGGAWQEGENPFPGLEPFTAARSEVFFGRSADARRLSNQLRAIDGVDRAGGLLAVVGPSGCGKSSLLNAALAPLLDDDPGWLRVPTLAPGTDPLPELARVLAATAAQQELTWSASEVRARLEAGPDGLRRVADDLLAATPGTAARRLLVMVDQAEELFTRTPPGTRERFAHLLSAALSGPVQVVLVLRSEFLDDLRTLPPLTGRLIDASLVAPLDQEMLREVIQRPARLARLSLDEGLVAALVADTGGGEALPLLAFILRRLAEDLPPGATLSLSRYRELGGVHGALSRHADATLTKALQASGLTEPEVLTGLTGLITVDHTGRRARRRIPLPSPADPLRGALQVFVERRLLLSDTDDGHLWLTLTHEALLTKWRPLKDATDEIITALRAARVVEQAAAEWASADRAEHYLWDDKRLTATLVTLGIPDNGGSHHVAVSRSAALDETARAFLDASAHRVSRTKERQRRRRLALIAVLSSLLLLVTTASIFAVYQRNIAQTQRDTAILNQILVQADRLRSTDSALAAQLTLTGYRLRPTPDFHAALLNTGNAVLSTPLTGHTATVSSAVFSPDGRILASGSEDGTVRLWNVADPTHPTPLATLMTGHTSPVSSVVFSPDGRILASNGGDGTVRSWGGGTVRLWNVTDPAHPAPLGQLLTGHTSWTSSVVFSPDGHTLATGGDNTTVQLWNVADPAHPTPLATLMTGHTSPVSSVVFSPDGRTLASGSENGKDGTVRLWNVADPEHPTLVGQPLTGHTGTVHSMVFSPDGRTLASGSDDQTVRLWNVADPKNPTDLSQPLTGHTYTVRSVVFSPDGRTLASGSDDQTVRLWNIPDSPLTGHTGTVHSVVFSPDGRTLASGSWDETVRLWNVADPAHPAPLGPPLTGHTGAVVTVVFSPDGHTLASGSYDSTVRLWNVADPAHPTPLGPPLTGHANGTFWSVVFSPDGRTLASGSSSGSLLAFSPDGSLLNPSEDRTVRLWNVADPAHPTPLGTGYTGPVSSVAFSPDGRTLASGSYDQTVRLWNVADPAHPTPLGPPLPGHTRTVNSVVFSPDGRTLASGSVDGTVRLWNVADPEHPTPLGSPLTVHTGAIDSVVFSPDGRTLASGSWDNTVRLWNVADLAHSTLSGQPLTGHTSIVGSVVFSPDGRTLASGSHDGTVRLWNRDLAIQRICATTTNALTPAKWDQYVSPDLPYRPPCP
ncbi:MAG: TIR domain-containing protein [Pseudonocardiaceae bacterium]